MATTGAPRSRAVFVDRMTLDSMMHLPRAKAAETLGLCSTTFKKVCRCAGLKVWPYRRLLLGAIQDGDAPMSSSRRFSEPSAFHETLLPTEIAPQPIALQPIIPLRYVDLSSPSFPFLSSSSPSSSSSMAAAANAACSLSYLAPCLAQRSCPIAPSTHVVDAVMDYLDTLSSGPPAAKDMAALHLCELEAVVEGLGIED